MSSSQNTTGSVMTEMETIQVKVIDRDGELHELEGPTDMGLNLMELTKAYGLPVQGTCGGMALCASCHCFVKSEHELPDQSDEELGTLDTILNSEDNSRLTCQLSLRPELDGLVVELAPEE